MKQTSPFGQALIYGLTAGPLAMLSIPLYIYLPTYYYQLGVELGVVGAMLLLARVTDVFSDPLIGWWRDYSGSKGRYGSMVMGWVLLLIGLWQLLLPTGAVGALHLLFWAMWVYLAWTLIMIPYHALSVEVSQHHHSKTYYTAAREAFSMVGVLALPFWVLLSKKIGKYAAWRLSMMTACLSFICVFLLEPGDLWAFAIISGFVGLSVGADVALPSSIQADIAQALSVKHGAMNGQLFGVWGMLTKLALAFA